MCDEDADTAFETELVCVAVVIAKGNATVYAKGFDEGSNGAIEEGFVRAETLGIGGTGGDVAVVGYMGFGLSPHVFLIFKAGAAFKEANSLCMTTVALFKFPFKIDLPFGADGREGAGLVADGKFVHFSSGTCDARLREGTCVKETNVDGGLESCRDGDGMSLKTEDGDTSIEPVGSGDKVLSAVWLAAEKQHESGPPSSFRFDRKQPDHAALVAFEFGGTAWEVFPGEVAVEALGGDLVVVLSIEHVDVNGTEDLCDVLVEECGVELIVVAVGKRWRDGGIVGVGDGFNRTDGLMAKAGMMEVEVVRLEGIQMVATGRLVDDGDGGAIACDEALGKSIGGKGIGKGD
ncbi:hypothetical protein SARC_14127, partial [Sphaeroforma arctica JP610]